VLPHRVHQDLKRYKRHVGLYGSRKQNGVSLGSVQIWLVCSRRQAASSLCSFLQPRQPEETWKVLDVFLEAVGIVVGSKSRLIHGLRVVLTLCGLRMVLYRAAKPCMRRQS
jgi:hypothetical protein